MKSGVDAADRVWGRGGVVMLDRFGLSALVFVGGAPGPLGPGQQRAGVGTGVQGVRARMRRRVWWNT